MSTNYTLISNYEDFEAGWNHNLEVWNSQIQSIQNVLTSINNHLDIFKEQIVNNISHLESRVEKSLKVFRNLSKDIKVQYWFGGVKKSGVCTAVPAS